MKPRELENLGVPRGAAMKLALELCGRAADAGLTREQMRGRIASLLACPSSGIHDPHFGDLARELVDKPVSSFIARDSPAPWRQWGADLEAQSVEQMVNACQLPVAVAGALMPDAHVGYGLPIGGVLATDNAIIPYAVGVDIACRMKLTVLEVPSGAHAIKAETDRLIHSLERETRFGIGASFKTPHQHPVMDDDWTVSPITRQHKDKAWSQLGSSGSGNHFVEFGTLTLDRDDLGLKAGAYLALLSHSGSRGTGALVADHYSRLAMSLHPELPRHLKQLAWLDLAGEAGQEYWAAMNLMGRYAAANHAMIHRSIARALGADVLLDVENHHNFAWREVHRLAPSTESASDAVSDRTVIVHRKGATPAGAGVLGIIPGSMASPGFVVRGKGSEASMQSASHGAGRVMSRTQARASFTWSNVKKLLAERDVILLSAGLDEVPGVYKDIHQVMNQQRDLVDIVARFDPRIVKMAPAGERAED
jgi:tRNA-splicing ligase RtcB